MGNKLGLDEMKDKEAALVSALEKMLATIQPDMTIFYQLLIDLPYDVIDKETSVQHFAESFYQELSQEEADTFFNWIQQYAERRAKNRISREDAVTRMRQNNPRFILRNYLLHQAIEDLEKGDDELFKKLQDAMKDPYSKRHDEFFRKRPSWATQKAGCSMLSCSS